MMEILLRFFCDERSRVSRKAMIVGRYKSKRRAIGEEIFPDFGA
jgi:hypothetical protein